MPLDDVVAITLGANHSCAVRGDGTIMCWGANEYGQLGTGSQTPEAKSAVPVFGIDDAVDAAAGHRHTCALIADDTIQC